MSTHTAPPSPLPRIVTRDEWERARADLLAREKAHTRAMDALSAERRRMPMLEVRGEYVLAGEHGQSTLLELFEGRRQLIVYHFMFHPDWDEGCDGCSMVADFMGPLSHIHARDTSLAMVSRAPIGKILPFRQRMGWTQPWYSSFGTTFNEDFHATVDGEEHHGMSVFLRDGDRVFLTWNTADRGIEFFVNTFRFLDVTPFGRQEAWEDSPAGWPQTEPYSWWRHHDRYQDQPTQANGCCH